MGALWRVLQAGMKWVSTETNCMVKQHRHKAGCLVLYTHVLLIQKITSNILRL